MYVCRKCDHVGSARIKHWEMEEWRQDSDGSSYLHKWSGSTAYCKECNAIVKTKRGWAFDDYNEEFGGRNFLLMLLYPLILMGIYNMVDKYNPYEWVLDFLCNAGLLTWVMLVMYLNIFAPEKYADQIVEEE
jgi:hypothetical protein